MTTTGVPITPESFQLAIADLELEQLHAESSRLHNSIFHLERSNISLEEFEDDEDCRAAIAENTVTIGRQKERIQMIQNEVERRGFLMPCGERKEDAGGAVDGAGAINGAVVNGARATDEAVGNGSGDEVIRGEVTTTNAVETAEAEGEGEIEGGIYL